MKAVFLDRDGTIIAGIPKFERIDSVEKVEILPKVVEALGELAKLDYGVFFVTNQAGIAEGLISMDDFTVINNKVLEIISPSGIRIIKTSVCPHAEGSNCECRKPKPKMILDAAKEYGIDLKSSYMIGDRLTDIETGSNAGTKTVLVQTGAVAATDLDATHTSLNLLEAVRYIAGHQE
jgi:D-glycero-D-manno-heptose 1,7-bisphosphate phosphatase